MEHVADPDVNRMLIMGTQDGSVMVYNPVQQSFVENGRKAKVARGQIIGINASKKEVVLATSEGNIWTYKRFNSLFPHQAPAGEEENKKRGQDFKPKCFSISKSGVVPITCMSIEEGNGEGIFGTRTGDIYYINMADQEPIRIVNRLAPHFEKIMYARFDPTNPHIFLSTVGERSGDIKLMTAKTFDYIYTFPQFAFGPVAFLASSKSKKQDKRRIIGHKAGYIRFISVDQLKVEFVLNMELQEGEQLTCGFCCSNNINFVVGTSFGDVYIGSYKKNQDDRFCATASRL